MPNLAVCLTWVALFYSIFLFHASRELFRDSDTGWHIRAGERLLTTLALPRSDPYSFSRGGQPWFEWEWASDVLMGVIHRAAGLRGVAVLYVLTISLVVWLWVRLNWAVGGNFFFTAALAGPMLSATTLHWLARPHVFSWVLLLIALLNLERAPQRSIGRQVLVFGGLGAVWANVHASFFLLPLIALIYAAGQEIAALLWDGPGVAARKMWIAPLAALAGTFLNPYGFRLHEHVLRYLTDRELLDRVAEFQTFNFHVDGAGQLLFMLGVCALGGVLALTQGKIAHFLLAALFLSVALRSARGLPLAALVLLPLANAAIVESLRQANHLRASVRRALASFLAYSDRLRTLDATVSGLAWTPLIALLIPFAVADAAFPPDQFPVQAATRLTSGVRLFAPDKYGGYLIYRFKGSLPIFFDGRSDFYGPGFMKSYIRLVEVRPGWREQFDAWRFTQALLPVDYALIPALEASGWKETYRDETAVLLQPAKD